MVREICNALPGLSELKASAIIKETVRLAYDSWPDMISESQLLPEQKIRLMSHFTATPAIASLIKRAAR